MKQKDILIALGVLAAGVVAYKIYKNRKSASTSNFSNATGQNCTDFCRRCIDGGGKCFKDRLGRCTCNMGPAGFPKRVTQGSCKEFCTACETILFGQCYIDGDGACQCRRWPTSNAASF